jgi:hypothetical protein
MPEDHSYGNASEVIRRCKSDHFLWGPTSSSNELMTKELFIRPTEPEGAPLRRMRYDQGGSEHK